jgi:hypothetical protein
MSERVRSVSGFSRDGVLDVYAQRLGCEQLFVIDPLT